MIQVLDTPGHPCCATKLCSVSHPVHVVHASPEPFHQQEWDIFLSDDVQQYLKTAANPSAVCTCLHTCLEERKAWMKQSESEALLVCTPHQVYHSSITHPTVTGHIFSSFKDPTSLSPLPFKTWASSSTFCDHIKQPCNTLFYHHKNIAKLCPTLSLPDLEKRIHYFVSSRLDSSPGSLVVEI